MNALEDQPRFVQEAMDVNQGKLVMGWRLGDCMEDPDQAAILTFNTVFGAGSRTLPRPRRDFAGKNTDGLKAVGVFCVKNGRHTAV